MPPEWIAASYASQFVAATSSEVGGQMTICERAHAGLIQTKAQRLTVDQNGKRYEQSNVVLPKEFWWAEGHASLDQNWQTGDFSTWIKDIAHWRAFGVSFDFAALIELVPAADRGKALATISVTNNPDWVAARVADGHVRDAGISGGGASQRAILEHCRTGHVVARALRMEMRRWGWDGAPDAVAVEWDVPLWFWRNFTGSDSWSQQWDIGTFSGKGRCAECDGYVKLSGVHFLAESLATLTGQPGVAASAELPADKASGGPGRRKKHDWEGALIHLIGLAELDGIAPDPKAHGAQTDVANLMAEWFAQNGGEVPESSQLRAYAKRALEAIGKRSANK